MKKTVLVSWLTTPVSLCQSKDLQLDIQKNVLFLKMLLSFGFCAFGFGFVISLPLWMKTHHGPVISPFCVQHLQYFYLRRRCPSK